MAAFFDDLNSVIMRMVMLLMQLAPIGIFCLIAKLFAGLGIGVIVSLGAYFFAVVLALLLHCFGTYSLLLRAMTGLSPRRLFRQYARAYGLRFQYRIEWCNHAGDLAGQSPITSV